MAHRYLENGDFVKVRQHGQNFGKFGRVEDVNGYNCIVAIYEHQNSEIIVDRFVISMSGLLVAERSIYEYKLHNNHKCVDNDDECEYLYWSHDDLVERIKQLEMQIEEIEK